MRAPFFSQPHKIPELLAAAQSWIGTPFRPHASIKGAGVDCVHLAFEIYRECRFHFTFDPPKYSMDGGRHLKMSKVIAWLEQSDSFDPVVGDTMPGDLLLFNMGRVDHHVGVKLEGTRFINAINRYGVRELDLMDPTWRCRFTVAYRPMEYFFSPA
ncbi:MAG TPA: NlpC/P60 family protein [Terriglobales bacterium]|jgi:cell wall-associated NlpC family hydrolase|nr:NlpC/P60 family protein [Terriglobales bacterium]